MKPYDKLTKEQRNELYEKYKKHENNLKDVDQELMDELKADVKKAEDGGNLTTLADKNKTNQDKRQEKITNEKNKAMNELLKGNFGAALKGLGTMFLLQLQDEKLTEDENEALKTAAEKFGENKNVLIANMLKEQGVSKEIIDAVAKSGDLKDLTDEQKKKVAEATEKLEKPKPEEIPSKKDITSAAEEVNKEMTNAEKNVTDGEDDDETTWEDMDDEDKKKLIQDLKDGDLDDVDENELRAIYVEKEKKEPAEDIEDEKEEDDGDEEDAEVDDGNGGKKKIVNPKKVWKRKKNKATGKTTKSYYNGKKDSKGHPISISKKEFQEKVKAYQEAKKKGVSESRTIVSFDTFIRKRLFESRKK